LCGDIECIGVSGTIIKFERKTKMVLSEKERNVICDLQTQEKSCIEKYKKYAGEAHDSELKNLFETLQRKEQQHYNSLQKVLDGDVLGCNCNDSDGEDYEPKATYDKLDDSEEKKSDCFLATDCIASEKLVSSEYNSDVFAFANSKLRKLLADIQIEEQNHAEMLWKYKTANGMA
jgi:rubrerythrin